MRSIAIWTMMICGAACAQTPQKAPPPPMTVARLYDSPLRTIESELVPLAEAMPAEKYNFAPTQGEFTKVRTFALQVRHVAATLYMIGAAVQKEKNPVDPGTSENGPDTLKTKEDIVKFLKDAFAYAHKGMQMLTAENQLEMVPSPFGSGSAARGGIASAAAWHSFDHYGQMVVYARMNGIVPPASR
jgi:hypothetical protein